MKKGSTVLFIALILLLFLFTAPARAYVWEGFERENLWVVSVMDGNAANAVRIATNKRTEGRFSLELDLEKTGSESKGFVSREGAFDLSKVAAVEFDIYIDSPVKVSVGLSTGPSYSWYETAGFTLKKGWNRNLKAELAKKAWASAETGWQPSAVPKNLSDAKKLVFIFTQGRTGKVYLDNIRFTGGKVPNDAYTMPFDPVEKEKLEDEYGMLETLAVAGWAAEKSPGVKKEKDLYVLEYKDVNNTDKAAYKVQQDLDWTDYAKILLKLRNNSGDFCCFAMGIQTGNGWKWYETAQTLLKPNRSAEVTVLLNAPNFKSEESGWNHNTPLYEKNMVKSVNFIIYGMYGKTGSGSVTVESLKLLKGNPFVPEKTKK